MMDNTFLNFNDEEQEENLNQSGMVKGVPRYVLDQINSNNEGRIQPDYLGPRSA